MKRIEKINDDIHRITLPYKDIYTTVYIIETQEGTLLFDTGSSHEDVEHIIKPLLKSTGIDENSFKYVFISHNHEDHVGGLNKILDIFPKVCIITNDTLLKEEYMKYNVLLPEECDTIFDVLKIIPISGHTKDCCALLDIRTNTLISGDCLQFYGVFGSGAWGTNICFPTDYLESIERLKNLNIDRILAAHDYYPYGQDYIGKESVCKALNICIEAFDEIKELIMKNINSNFDEICNLYNTINKPTIGKHVIDAIRKTI